MSSRTRRPYQGAVHSPAPRRSSQPPRRSRGPRLPGLLLFVCGIVVGAALVRTGCWSFSGGRAGERTAAGTAASAAVPARLGEERAETAERVEEGQPSADAEPEADSGDASDSPGPSTPGPAAGERVREPRIALVIDDLGRSVADVEALAQLGVPLTYAVLPYEVETPQVVEALRRQGAEILCHLPMEPSGNGDPGPGALWYGMDAEELRRSTAAALAEIPGAVGVNNHMGSRLSADETSMRAVLGVLAERRLFFLDSRTSAESVGYRLALNLGLHAAERQVFLDDDQSPEGIRKQFARLLALARQRGFAIAIGHPHESTLATLAAELPRAREQGFRFVKVSELLAAPREASGGGP
jgi:uncharacterized protein